MEILDSMNSVIKRCKMRFKDLCMKSSKDISECIGNDDYLGYISENIGDIVTSVENSIIATGENNEELQLQRGPLSLVKMSDKFYSLNSYGISTEFFFERGKTGGIDAVIRLPIEVIEYIEDNAGNDFTEFFNPTFIVDGDLIIFREVSKDLVIKIDTKLSIERLIRLLNLINFSLWIGSKVSRKTIFYYNSIDLRYEGDHTGIFNNEFYKIISGSKLYEFGLGKGYHKRGIMMRILLNYMNARHNFEKDRFKPSSSKKKKREIKDESFNFGFGGLVPVSIKA